MDIRSVALLGVLVRDIDSGPTKPHGTCHLLILSLEKRESRRHSRNVFLLKPLSLSFVSYYIVAVAESSVGLDDDEVQCSTISCPISCVSNYIAGQGRTAGTPTRTAAPYMIHMVVSTPYAPLHHAPWTP